MKYLEILFIGAAFGLLARNPSIEAAAVVVAFVGYSALCRWLEASVSDRKTLDSLDEGVATAHSRADGIERQIADLSAIVERQKMLLSSKGLK